MRPLCKFQSDILAGKFDHPPAVIERFRTAYLAAGFDVPPRRQPKANGRTDDGFSR